ncbi:MAG TPA: hypothetical protein PKV98_04320 [Burkholderiaceae bacterium]|nr:hypothetical protein [Burkholderiaceae bacterium]
MNIDTIQADVMLLGWSETHNGGAKITLQLADIAQLEPFKKMTLKKGKIAGQLMTAVFVEVDGNGQPVPPEPEKPKRGGGKFPGGYCGLAVMWAGDGAFLSFVMDTYPSTHSNCLAALGPGSHDIEEVGGWCIKNICGITSRKQLDTDDRARASFEGLIRKPYMEYRKERGLE